MAGVVALKAHDRGTCVKSVGLVGLVEIGDKDIKLPILPFLHYKTHQGCIV